MKRLFAVIPLAQHGAEAAAVPVYCVEQLVPEGAGAETWHDGEIQADISDGAA
jgi:hypothetical protein